MCQVYREYKWEANYIQASLTYIFYARKRIEDQESGRQNTNLWLTRKERNGRNTKIVENKKNTINMYIIRSLAMTNWLCNHGFQILKVEDSEKNEKLKVFFFEDSPALHEIMMQYRRKG